MRHISRWASFGQSVCAWCHVGLVADVLTHQSSLHLLWSGEERPWLHLCLGFRQRRAQQRPLLLWRLHQLHLHHLHLQHGREWTEALVSGGVLVHADHHLQQRGELRPEDCEDCCVCVCVSMCVCCRFPGSPAKHKHMKTHEFLKVPVALFYRKPEHLNITSGICNVLCIIEIRLVRFLFSALNMWQRDFQLRSPGHHSRLYVLGYHSYTMNPVHVLICSLEKFKMLNIWYIISDKSTASYTGASTEPCVCVSASWGAFFCLDITEPSLNLTGIRFFFLSEPTVEVDVFPRLQAL